MARIWVGLSATITETDMERCLRQWFPAIDVRRQIESRQGRGGAPDTIVFSVVHWPVEDFPTYLSFDFFPGSADNALAISLSLARRLATGFACRTICDGTGLGDDDAPHWTVVWQDDQPYLASDAGTDFGDGAGGPVRLGRQLALEVVDLDEAAKPYANPLTNETARDR